MTASNLLLENSHPRCVTSTSVAEGKKENKGFSGRKHSEESRRKMGKIGSDHSRWKGGRIIDKDGYVLIKNREHSQADNTGYIREHRLVMEKHLGRPLLKTELVHHINGDKQDNRIENLQLFSPSEHMTLECTGRILVDMSNRICSKCGSKKTRTKKTNGRPEWFKSITTKKLLCSKCCMKEYYYLNKDRWS